MSYRETVLSLLKMKGATPKLIATYNKELEEEVSDLFFVIAQVIAQKELKANQSTGKRLSIRK